MFEYDNEMKKDIFVFAYSELSVYGSCVEWYLGSLVQ